MYQILLSQKDYWVNHEQKMELIRIPKFLEPSSAASIWITSTMLVEMSFVLLNGFQGWIQDSP